MNLATRRLTEAQFREWSAAADHHTLVLRVSDRFDDYGLTGIASLAVSNGAVTVADFLLSCRVMGRGVEEVMFSMLMDCARESGRLG